MNESQWVIDQLIKKLSDSEFEEYNEALNIIPHFQLTNKNKILTNGNVSPLFQISLAQNEKYRQQYKTNKTIYKYRDNDSNDVKKIIECLNNVTDEDQMHQLLCLKNIYLLRSYNTILDTKVKPIGYDQYKIKAGSKIYCRKCSSDKTTLETKQKRRADEPSETFYKCLDCGLEFKDHL